MRRPRTTARCRPGARRRRAHHRPRAARCGTTGAAPDLAGAAPRGRASSIILLSTARAESSGATRAGRGDDRRDRGGECGRWRAGGSRLPGTQDVHAGVELRRRAEGAVRDPSESPGSRLQAPAPPDLPVGSRHASHSSRSLTMGRVDGRRWRRQVRHRRPLLHGLRLPWGSRCHVRTDVGGSSSRRRSGST